MGDFRLNSCILLQTHLNPRHRVCKPPIPTSRLALVAWHSFARAFAFCAASPLGVTACYATRATVFSETPHSVLHFVPHAIEPPFALR